MKKPSGCRKTYHFGMKPHQWPSWFMTISRNDSDPASMMTAASAMP